MRNTCDKMTVTCDILKGYSRIYAGSVGEVFYTPSDYKKNDTPPTDGWQPFKEGDRISGRDSHYWFKMSFISPSAKDNQYIILNTSNGFEEQRNTLNPQSMIFANGKIMQALDTNHSYVRLDPLTEYEIYIYYYVGLIDESCEFKLNLQFVDEPSLQLYYDIFVPLSACKDVYIKNSYNYVNTLKILEQAANILELNYPYTDEYYKGIAAAREFLRTEYYEKLCGNSSVIVNCIGHTHIDVAWLWTLAQTKEKVQRSFATVLELMKYYPEYRFMMSQPQLFKYISEVAPEMYAEIKELVRQGRFELEGAMWLEADCNLISGESMVRQLLHGKIFLKEEFDIDSKILWLPDVFGYSAAMPQILKKSGIERFITSKISWNDTNIMPYDSFIWQGIDGSEIKTDFITVQDFKAGGEFTNETTYVGEITPSMVAGAWNRYQQKEYNNEIMLIYGYGDGGGGPTAEMLENQRRLSYGLPDIPKTRISSLKEYVARSEEKFVDSCNRINRVPRWVGELYLEFHRGTYTSMAKNKRYNRKSEMLLQSAESLSTLNSFLIGSEYKKKEFYSLWDTVLLNQFHDIIPGSSIREVYEDSHLQYEQLIEKTVKIIEDGISELAHNISGTGVLVYNSLGFERNEVISVNGKSLESGLIPAYGWKVIEPVEALDRVKIFDNTAENDFYILTLDSAGRIARLYDKRFGREVITKNAVANEIRIFEDMPILYENWELSNYYASKCKVLDSDAHIESFSDGCRKGFKVQHRYHNSVITQCISLYDTIERIDVDNIIDWAEQKQLVKMAFPFNVHTTKATYDIQFGSVERNTHKNTSWDSAKFEVCGHKWVDVSEYGYGVSLLNDCKYGFSADGSELSLTVLKCGTYPSEIADQGKHEFRYSILPHDSDWRQAGTVMQAYSINRPLIAARLIQKNEGSLPDYFSFVSTDNANVIIDTVKQCEDSQDIIIRLYDAFDSFSNPVIKFGMPICRAELCDLMENTICKLSIENNSVKIELTNFEIVTLKIS